MIYAISTHLYHDRRLTRDHVHEMAAHGFEAIELFATRSHFDYHNRSAIESLDGWLKESGMRLHSVHAPISESLTGAQWGTMFSNATTDEPMRARWVHEATASLQIAKQIAFAFLVVHLGQPNSQKPTSNDNRLEVARRSIQELHRVAQPLDVRLALELIPNSISSAETLVRLIEDDLQLSDVGICMDFGHGFLMGDLVDAIETASGYLITTHVHDNHGKSDEHLVPLEGGIDWPSALMATQKIGYDGALVMEVANTATPIHVLSATARARQYFQEIFGAGIPNTEY